MQKLALCLVIQELGGPGLDNSLPGMSGPTDPGYGRPIYHPGHPDHGLPSQPGHPGNWVPGQGGPGHPGNALPGSPGHPSNRPPGSIAGLPSHPIYNPPAGTKPPAPGSSPGAGLWVVAYVPGQGFKWVSVSPGVPEKPQPTPPGGTVDNTLPTVPVDPSAPDQGLPPTDPAAQPK